MCRTNFTLHLSVVGGTDEGFPLCGQILSQSTFLAPTTPPFVFGTIAVDQRIHAQDALKVSFFSSPNVPFDLTVETEGPFSFLCPDCILSFLLLYVNPGRLREVLCFFMSVGAIKLTVFTCLACPVSEGPVLGLWFHDTVRF